MLKYAVLLLTAEASLRSTLPIVHIIGPNPQYLQTTDKFYEDEGATCYDPQDGWISELIDIGKLSMLGCIRKSSHWLSI